MNRTLALVRRALRVDSRDIRPHLFRCALAGVVLFTLFSTQLNSIYSSAPGRDLFQWVMYYNYWFITAAGATFFATAITEEKEERTLGLMKMAGVSSAAILAGKWIPKLVGALLLVLIQIPFTALAITLGGVLWGQVFASYVALLAHLFFVGNIGLLASVIRPSMSGACGLSVVVLLLFHIVPPMFASALISILPAIPTGGFYGVILKLCESLTNMCACWRLSEIMMTGFKQSVWSFQVISNLVVGSGLLFLSWLLFEPCTKNEVEPGVESSWLGKSRHIMNIGHERRSWQNALLWKEFHYLGGGMLVILLKLVAYAMLVLILAMAAANWKFRNLDGDMLAFVSFIVGLILIIFELGMICTRVYRQEMTQQTWSLLSMLPMSLPTVSYTKLTGGLFSLIPAVCCCCSCILFSPDDVLDTIGDILTDGDGMIIVFYMTTQVLLGIHFATYLSISARWAVWPLSVFLGGFAIFLFNMMLTACLTGARGSEEGIVFLMGCFAIVIIVVTHIKIGLRLTAMASE